MFDFLGKKKKKRKNFTPGAQKATLAKQDYKCVDCGEKFNENRRPHFDHIDGDRSNKHVSNCQAFCAICNDNKTNKETQERVKKNEKRS